MLALRDIKEAIRQPYAWPGGYPQYFVCADGEPLSIKDARENWREIAHTHILTAKHGPKGYSDPQWTIVACEVNWEDQHLFSAHSGEAIECAYPGDDG